MTNVCTKCRKTFQHRSGLSRHRKMCGKAPQRVECTICQRNFADGRGLSQHQKTVHKSDVYCIECRKPLKDMTAYENHRRNAHGLEPGPSTRNNNQEEVENLNTGPSRKVIITGVEVPAPHKVPEEEEVEVYTGMLHRFHAF